MGATVGGGIGVSTGLHGLSLDSLRSVRMVTASGEVVTASEDSNADLFWGIRGAGAQFGVITEATYEVYDETNEGNVVLGQFSFAAAANASLWEALAEFDEELPAELALTTSMSYNRTSGTALVSANVIYWGPMDDARPYLNRFTRVGSSSSSSSSDYNNSNSNGTDTSLLLSSTVRQLTRPELYSVLSTGVCSENTGIRINTMTLGLGRTDVDTWTDAYETMTAFWEEHPTYAGVLTAQRYSNDKVMEVSSETTSYPWRDTKTFL